MTVAPGATQASSAMVGRRDRSVRIRAKQLIAGGGAHITANGGDVPSDGTVPATVSCPGVSTSEDSSVQSRFIDDGQDPSALPPFGGEEKLAGSHTDSAGIANLAYNWDLR